MQYVQGGADFSGPKTKTNLKKQIKENPHTVYLYDTTAVAPSKFNGPASELPDSIKFNVVGPDPYRARNWYATVYVGVKGNLVVS